MFSELNNSKEGIRGRMLKHALNYWTIKNPEDLDPFVKLVLEALSTELYNLGNNIRDTEVRLLEKVANLLAPEFSTSPSPAHCILHATPAGEQELLEETIHFYTQKKISSKQDETLDKTIDVFFTPVANVRLFNAHISCQVSGNNLFVYDSQFNRQLYAQTNQNRRTEHNVLWLGVNISEMSRGLNKLFFYFDWKNIDYGLSTLNYQLLSLTKWYIHETQIKTTEGIPYEHKQGTAPEGRNLSIDYDLLSLIENDVKEFYDRKFISIDDDRFNNPEDLQQEYPPSFRDIFKEADLQKLNKKLVWLKIIFPAALQQASLDEVNIFTNSFPVINRQLNDLKRRLTRGSNIIPLKTNGLDQFLAVRSLNDESHPYKSTPFRKMEDEETGTYTLRYGGVERFDERNAKEFISYLLELLRSESAAFSAYGNDFIASTLREMNQRIALMEQKTKGLANHSTEIPHYIIAKPHEGNELMYVEYWATLAEKGNAVRSGTKFQEYNGMKLRSDSLFLLTTSTGGKNRLKPEERVNAFRYGLITRNRIITKEDIRNFCLCEMGNRISKVTVEKNFEMSVHPSHGFVRTIDITLTAIRTELLNDEGWQSLIDQLKSKLQSRSGMSNHYRIFLNK